MTSTLGEEEELEFCGQLSRLPLNSLLLMSRKRVILETSFCSAGDSRNLSKLGRLAPCRTPALWEEGMLASLFSGVCLRKEEEISLKEHRHSPWETEKHGMVLAPFCKPGRSTERPWETSIPTEQKNLLCLKSGILIMQTHPNEKFPGKHHYYFQIINANSCHYITYSRKDVDHTFNWDQVQIILSPGRSLPSCKIIAGKGENIKYFSTGDNSNKSPRWHKLSISHI